MDLREYESQVAASSDLWELWDVCTRFCKDRSIERVYYAHLPPIGAPDAEELRFMTEGFNDQVVKHYFSGGYYRTSRNMAYAKTHPEPFYWDEVSVEPAEDIRDPVLAKILTEVTPGHGMCLSVFGPNGRNGFCSLEFPPGITRLSFEDVWAIQWASQLAHIRYCALWVPELGTPPSLSAREQEVLVWVARGKSNPSIAEILGISAHTVDAHLRRIYLKLGVFDRITAAVRGIGSGLIKGEI